MVVKPWASGVSYKWGFLISGFRRAKKFSFAPSAQNEPYMMNPRVSLIQGFLISGEFLLSVSQAENRKRFFISGGFLWRGVSYT